MLDDDTAHSNAIMADSTQFAAMQDTSAFIIFRVKNTNILAAKKYGITQQTTQLAEQIANTPASKLLVIYASPYALSFFDTSTLNKFDAILVAYQDMDEAQMAVSSIIFGEKPAKGHLPVSVFTQDGQKIYSTGAGLSTIQNELYTALPESTGWKSEWMQSIDSIALSGIAAQAYPGCQILVAKGNAVIYNKSFGHFTYDKDVTPKVENSDIYDLASLSKIFGTTLSYMKIYEDSCFNLDDHISKVIHRLSRSAKGKLTYRQLLAHQAGLKATLQWLPADNIYQRHEILSRKYDEDDYPYQVADSVFLYKNYRNQIRKMIDESPLAEKPKYVYSDLGFYYLNEAFQSITKESIDKFATDSFYKPMGLKNIGYHPLQWVSLSRIAPTENDTLFRKQVVKGYVHDPLIALSGGVGGSAGLFGNAYDVAVLCRMLLQGGVYADKQYLQPETIALFTSSDFSSEWNRRAGGFDKPLLKPNGTSPCCEQASPSSFGHSGFTGTYFWVDPEHDLIYIFLSNRIYPNASPNKLASMNIRTKIQELLYEFDAKEQ
ncbi:MAG: serine hydrolase, partial [Bacteroidales bacterium]|jgi:CubicO group peptidase (beta-lactamase class C family)|nr:serine hydrolase [Bacteroidales bacterium]